MIKESNLRNDTTEENANVTTTTTSTTTTEASGASPTTTPSSDPHKDASDNTHSPTQQQEEAHTSTSATKAETADTPPSTHLQPDTETDEYDPELDGPDFAVKHQLQSSWTLWYDYPNKQAVNWEDNLQRVYTFNTVEDFWSVFNHIKPPSKLGVGSNYHLFKDDIRPMWEDKANKFGGKWLVQPNRDDPQLDEWWRNTVMACIGETFEPGEEICGVVVSIRKDKNRLALWTKTANDESLCLQIGKQFRHYAEFYPHERMAYLVHEDTLKTSSFRNKGRYRL